MLTAGSPAPTFSTTDHRGETVVLSEVLKQGPVALIFYPKSDTPGCTKQMCSIRDGQVGLDKAGVHVFGINYDTADEYQAFVEKYGLTTNFLVDADKSIGVAYGMPESGYPARKTFVIGQDGKIANVIDQIDFSDHASQILSSL